ncbi:MAG: M43 family zinc metalloprotease, partial [Planctomycetota bacterium]
MFTGPGDCAYASNYAGLEYDPEYLIEIPVVWHVLTTASGFGDVTDQEITDQMAILNADYRPAFGAPGRDTGIQFRLATTDPAGNPTTGITRTANTTWFNDGGAYAANLAWDTTRYLNIYTMNPMGGGGVIGYVVDLPQSGIVGIPDDGVRMLHSAIASTDLNQVLAHEIGHYLGLYHTFGTTGACTNNSCQTQGDLICDTNPHQGPSGFCANTQGSCAGLPTPINNFMNYQEEPCIFDFTPNQIQRMRCTLENYRSLLFTALPIGTPYCTATANSTGAIGLLEATGLDTVSSNRFHLTATNLPSGQFAFCIGSQTQSFVQNPGSSQGNLCLGGTLARFNTQVAPTTAGTYTATLDLTSFPLNPTAAVQAGESWNFQCWHRDTLAGQPTSNFTQA